MNVLIIGSGISGMSAATRSASRGNKVTMVSPDFSERAQSVMAAGGINASSGSEDSPRLHAEDTLRGGCFIENERDVLRFCENAPKMVAFLERTGVPFSRDREGKVILREMAGHSCPRTLFTGSSTGKHIVTAFIRKCREYELDGRLTRITGLWFYSGLIRDGRCYGAVFYDPETGKLREFYADRVIIATGGQNAVFGKTTGSALCDGYAAARLFTQGVKLRNPEFIQYHPTTIETANKRMLITEAARGEGGRLYYEENGSRVYFMEEKYGEKGNLKPRDIVSRCIEETGKQVYLDISFLGEKKIKERLREIYELCLDYLDLDVTKESIPVAPSVHFFMGGIKVDANHGTNIKNLYAVGECCSKYHGANRLGGNSLLAAVYSGYVAGDVTGEGDSSHPDFGSYVKEEQARLDEMKKSGSTFPSVYTLRSLSETMNENLGIVRNGEKLGEGLRSLDFLLKAARALHYDPTVSAYENYRIYYLIILAKAITMAALERKESRGAHFRSDYPETKEEYRACTVAEYAEGEIKISFEKEHGGGLSDDN